MKRLPSIVRRMVLLLVRINLLTRDLTQGSVLFLCLLTKPGFFDRDYYLRTYKGGRDLRFAMLRYAFTGARQLRAPNAWFSQVAYLTEHPGVAGSGFLPVLYFLLRDPLGRGLAGATRDPVFTYRSVPVADIPANDGYDRFAELWPAIREDMFELRDVERYLSGAPSLGDCLSGARSYAAPPIIGRPLQRLIDALPERIDHLLVVPWLGISGGSERISQRLIRVLREHYGKQGVAIIGPDASFDIRPEQREAYGMPIVAFNDASSDPNIPLAISIDNGIELLDRLIVHHRPRTLHCINSWIGWRAFQERGQFYAKDCNLFGNIYSDVRFMGGIPAGAFWAFMPDCFDNMTGIFADNATVVRKAQSFFSYSPAEMERFQVVYTPVVGLTGQPKEDLRAFRDGREAHTLWMSRIAVEKRLELLADVARDLPERRFSIYGATIQGALPVDMTPLRAQPNIAIKGQYGELADLPFDDFDSYIFTTTAEGLPIALLEAAQHGLPLVAPDIGGIGEFVDDKTGWLVPGDNPVPHYVRALEEVRCNPGEARARVEAAQRRLLDRHSWKAFEASIHKTPGYLQDVASPAAARPSVRRSHG